MSELFEDLPVGAQIKALSIWQPWASLIEVGRKRFETRHWFTHHRGLVAIHAARELRTDISGALRRIVVAEFGADWRERLPRGALLGVAELRNCLPTDGLVRHLDAAEFDMGNFAPGRYAWQLEMVRRLDPPVPWRGRQGLFNVPEQAVGGGASP